MSETLLLLIGSLLGAAIGAIPGIYAIYVQRREKKAAAERIEAEAEKIAADITESVLRMAHEEIKNLQAEKKTMQQENEEFRCRVRELEASGEKMRHELDLNKEQLAATIAEYKKLLTVVRRLERGVRQLCGQLKELGHEPVFNLDSGETVSAGE